jgi:hypothetical protein
MQQLASETFYIFRKDSYNNAFACHRLKHKKTQANGPGIV